MIHNLRFFCQRVLPLVYDDSLSFQELLYKVVNKINEIIKTIDDLNTQEVIKATLKEWLENGTLENIIKEAYSEYLLNVGLLPKTIKGNVELDIHHEDIGIQGGCCIGDNKIVVYFPSNNSNVGLLECYNLHTKELIWSHNIQGYHGNTISYYDEKLYITACIDQTGSSEILMPYIIVVDINNPAVVEKIITMPVGIYSALIINGDIYALTKKDFVENIDNIVTVYDMETLNVKREFALQNYVHIVNKTRTQGLSCYHDGNIYIVDHNTLSVFGYDLFGELTYIGTVEQIMNKFRWIGELEFISYDAGKWYIGSITRSTGEHLDRLSCICEVGLYNSIVLKEKRPLTISPTAPRSTNTIVVATNTKPLDPFSLQYNHWVPTVDDAVNLMKSFNAVGRLRIDAPENYKGLAYIFNNFTGTIYGSANNYTPVYNLVFMNCNNLSANNLDFSNAQENTRTIADNDVSAHVFSIKSSISVINWRNAEGKKLYLNNSEIMLTSSAIDISRLSFSKVWKRSNWTGEIIDSDSFASIIYTLDN